METAGTHSLHRNHALRVRSFGRNRKIDAEPEVRFPPDQSFADGTRSRGTHSAAGAGARGRGNRESAIWIRRSVRQSAFATAAGLGGGICLPLVGPILFEVDYRKSRNHMRDPADG